MTFKRPNLYEVGITLVTLTVLYFMLGAPVIAYSGPNPDEAKAKFAGAMMWHSLICAPLFALGVMWTIRGRKRLMK